MGKIWIGNKSQIILVGDRIDPLTISKAKEKDVIVCRDIAQNSKLLAERKK